MCNILCNLLGISRKSKCVNQCSFGAPYLEVEPHYLQSRQLMGKYYVFYTEQSSKKLLRRTETLSLLQLYNPTKNKLNPISWKQTFAPCVCNTPWQITFGSCLLGSCFLFSRLISCVSLTSFINTWRCAEKSELTRLDSEANTSYCM